MSLIELSVPTSIARGLADFQLVGEMPDSELKLEPRWLIFSSTEGYRKPQYGTFKVTNRDNVTVAFRLRLKERHFPKFSRAYGFLKPGESAEISVMIPTSEQWPRDPLDYAGMRHKVLIENLVIPPNLLSILKDAPDAKSLCSRLFIDTNIYKPQTRLYTKLSILLPRVSDEWALVEVKTPLPASETMKLV